MPIVDGNKPIGMLPALQDLVRSRIMLVVFYNF